MFLNGFEVGNTSASIQVHIEGRGISQNGLELAIASSNAMDLKQIWVSYIIFSPQTLTFPSFGGNIGEEGFQGTKHKNIRSVSQIPNYPIMGLYRISSGFSLGLDIRVDENFILTYQSLGPSFSFLLAYVFVGANTADACQNCLNTEIYMLNSQCLTRCPAGTYTKSYQAGGFACVNCSLKVNEVINSQNTECVCVTGSSLIDTVCQTSSSGGNSGGGGSYVPNIT